MENKNVKLVEFSRNYSNEAKELLEDSIKEEFDSVIVYGFKENKIHMKISATKSTLQIIGALEMAKQDLLKSM